MHETLEQVRHEASVMLAAADLVVPNDHFVYKAGLHGDAYIDKEGLIKLGIGGISVLLKLAAQSAFLQGFAWPSFKEPYGVLGPAYGAIALAPLLTLHFCGGRQDAFFPARTELETDATGKRVHVIPEKLRGYYAGKSFVLIEDIVNNGTTIREVAALLRSIDAEVLAAICLVNRGGQTAESLGVDRFYPLLEVKMPQHEPAKCPLCATGVPINTKLGKGKRWVELFGVPPYLPGADFSAFWK